MHHSLDVIINCVGLVDPVKIRDAGSELLNITEHFDECALSYLSGKSDTLYINMSSGAVFGRVFDKPVDEHTCGIIDINHIGPNDFYSLAKIHAEAKHRALPPMHIVDIRVFSYFSRFADLNAHFFLNDILKCIKSKSDFFTTSRDMTRDYVHPDDLFALVQCCIEKNRINDVFDVYSRECITKKNILAYFSRQYGLRVVTRDDAATIDAAGKKDFYYSMNRKAADIGYAPAYNSLDTIKMEAAALLGTSS
ncbi:MAG: NAD-dependent epimerase/dehydratase family protein [Spirochaetes bacterium]|nr:NAD-dependent epimerase/dehydratase family protein [Spirochaetota bacterium]